MSNNVPSTEVYTAPPPNSNLAIISLIAGICGLTILPLIGSVVAVITGPMAKREIAESEGALGGEGFATAGIVMGWISIGLILIACCCGVVFLAIPLSGLLYGISAGSWYMFLPSLLALF